MQIVEKHIATFGHFSSILSVICSMNDTFSHTVKRRKLDVQKPENAKIRMQMSSRFWTFFAGLDHFLYIFLICIKRVGLVHPDAV